MHPLIITPLYPPAVGGAATYFGDLVPGLLQRPEVTRVTVLTERLAGEPDCFEEGGLCLLRLLPPRVGLRRYSWPRHAWSYVFTQLWFFYRLRRLAKQHRVDFIHFHTRYRGTLFYAALRRCGLPILADLRDKMSDPAQLAAVAQRLLCCAAGVRDFAIAGGYPAQAAELVPIAFHQPLPPTAAEVAQVRRLYQLGDGPFLLFVGDITPNKGVYELLEAFADWQPGHSGLKLVLVGSNRQGGTFLNRVRGMPDVLYLGQLAHSQVLALMKAAELLILPSRSEGLPTVILEAVALGTRVICPPGIPEFTEHLPQFVLPQVSAPAVQQMLDKVWAMTGRPVYPLEGHQVEKVVAGVAAAYARLIR